MPTVRLFIPRLKACQYYSTQLCTASDLVSTPNTTSYVNTHNGSTRGTRVARTVQARRVIRTTDPARTARPKVRYCALRRYTSWPRRNVDRHTVDSMASRENGV